MATTWVHKQSQQLQKDWIAVCEIKDEKKIKLFFDSHNKHVLDHSPWFLQDLIINNNVESLKYIFTQCDEPNFNTKFGSGSWRNFTPVMFVCYCGTFEMMQLMTRKGMTFPDQCGRLVAHLIENKAMSGNESYLAIEYLLAHSKADLSDSNDIIRSLCWGKGDDDAVKIAKLIESKTPFIKKNIASNVDFFPDYYLRYTQKRHYKFIQFLIDEDKIDTDKQFNAYMYGCLGHEYEYSDEETVQWLIKYNVDINGYESKDHRGYLENENNEITPLFHCCIAKKYNQIDLLLKYGANINKKCFYNEEEITPLQFCMKTFSSKYAEYYQNYATNNPLIGDRFLGLDISNISMHYDESELSLKDEMNTLLDTVNNQYMEKRQEIDELENQLNAKYKELKSLMKKRNEIENKTGNIELMIARKNTWMKFLNKWKEW
eukprot:439599_1